MTGRWIMTCVLAIASASIAYADDSGALSVEVAARDLPTELAAPVSKLLDPDAVVIADRDGNTLMSFWFRAAVPAQATAEQVANGLTYREIPEGTLVGVVTFAKSFIDYRKQEIAAGVYTLRFLVQPDVGDHMGTAPHPEFLVLSPAAKDSDPEQLEPKALIKLSSNSTGGDHPGVMLLVPNSAKEVGPKIVDKKGVKLLSLRRPVTVDGKNLALGFAVSVAGFSKSR